MKGSVKCAALLGGALALSGFLLQTFFANPIAGPFVMGVSSGAKLTVALARALCQEPEILVLDDPISYLDVHHRTELLFILRRMARNQGLAVILPLHEIDLAEKVADRVLCVKGETIACSGTPEEVFAAGNIEALFDLRPGRPCSFWSGHAIRTGCRRGSAQRAGRR